MAAWRLALPLASIYFLVGSFCVAAVAEEPGPAAKQADEMQIVITGKVLLPDGSPASRASVQAAGEVPETAPVVARTDGTGQFRVRGTFGNGAQLHAWTADGSHQGIVIIPAAAVRLAAATPITVTLAPAIAYEVTVLADGRPVEGAQVVASGHGFEVQGVSGADGKVHLQLPARERLRELFAWHPDLGVRGLRNQGPRPARDGAPLSLIPPGPLTIRVVDPEGRPIAGMELGLNVRDRGFRLGSYHRDRSGPCADWRRWQCGRALGPAGEVAIRRGENHRPRLEDR